MPLHQRQLPTAYFGAILLAAGWASMISGSDATAQLAPTIYQSPLTPTLQTDPRQPPRFQTFNQPASAQFGPPKTFVPQPSNATLANAKKRKAKAAVGSRIAYSSKSAVTGSLYRQALPTQETTPVLPRPLVLSQYQTAPMLYGYESSAGVAAVPPQSGYCPGRCSAKSATYPAHTIEPKPDEQAKTPSDEKPKSSNKETNSEKDFTFGLDVPTRYSSSVTKSSSESVVEDKPDKYTAPSLYLKWSHQYNWLHASAQASIESDRFLTTSDANTDLLSSAFKLAKTDGRNETFVPYVSVSNDTFFLPNFRRPDIAYNDIAAGVYSAIGWRDRELIPYDDSLIPYSDASDPGDVSFKIDVRVGRRIADYTDYQNTFIYAKANLSYYISNAWRAETTAKFRTRWYENYYGEKRVDIRPGASFSLVWSPAWLTAMIKRGEISLDFEYYRNFSNLPDKNSSVWEIGPTLSLSTKF